MEKSAEAFRTIGEMASILGVRTHVLRYWEEQFPMLKPLKRSGGRRHYRPADVALLHNINNLLNQEGYTIKGARKFLASRGRPGAAPIIQTAPSPTQPQLVECPTALPISTVASLRSIRDRLSSALDDAA